MKKLIIRYIIIPSLCLLSGAAFFYLNSVELPVLQNAGLAEAVPKKEQKKVVITDPKTKKKQLIVIDPPKWIDTTEMMRNKPAPPAAKPVEDKRGVLPDVELLKFVIQKGREGIPVLSLRNFVNFW